MGTPDSRRIGDFKNAGYTSIRKGFKYHYRKYIISNMEPDKEIKTQESLTAKDGDIKVGLDIKAEVEEKELLRCNVVSSKIPHRGTWWYVAFTVIFVVLSSVIIYFGDWSLLFFIVAASGYSLWRGHESSQLTLTITNLGIRINNRRFGFEKVDSFYFARFGDDASVNFILSKKYLPRTSYIFLSHDDAGKARALLQNYIPEIEERDESISDFIVRKLKI